MKKLTFVAAVIVATLSACGGDNETFVAEPTIPTPPPPVDPEPTLVAFAPDGNVSADITWTTYGVPHIKADNLQSLGFGSGYAYAMDNACILADQMVKVRSHRSKYFGPDKVLGSGDSANLISDFGYLAMGVMDSADKLYAGMSENTRALMEGYVAGFNKYIAETGIDNLAPECAGQEWVTPMTAKELTAYMFATSQMASGERFFDTAFFANPGDGSEYLPYVGISPSANAAQSSQKSSSANQKAVEQVLTNLRIKAEKIDLPNLDLGDLGSNGWGIGKDKSENGKGILLANPHFPYTGHLRFWQSHNTIPGVLDVTGGSLQGIPGVNLIGFNNNLAWTHTVSKSRRFVVYKLTPASENRMQYTVDGEAKDVDKRTYYVEMKTGANSSVILSKDYYYSHHGLMIETPSQISTLLGWTDSQAFTLRDAAEKNTDLIDHWLAMNLATNLEEFQQAFKDYDGIPWVNTMYADDQGNAFYIDKSRVLNLNDTALAAMRTDPVLVGTRQLAGFDILPGDMSLFEPNGLNSYEQAPKLLRSDFIQNSNDSYWATNPAEPLSGKSILYGDDLVPLSLRTRMGLKMLTDASGDDGKFNAQEVEAALTNNRVYLAEAVLDDLLAQCNAQGNTPVVLDNGTTVDVMAACTALDEWDGVMNKESKAGHIFREFAYKFSSSTQFLVPFDVSDPANTPHTLSTDVSVMKSFAAAVANVNASGLSLTASMGDIQFTEKSMPDGSASGQRFPWAGSKHVEGGFNVFSSATSDDTMYAIHQYPRVTDIETGKVLSSGLSTEGYHINYGSSWMYVVNFTEEGPVGNGILTYSQSSDSNSEHFDDQNAHYSETGGLRPMLFKESDVEANKIRQMTISLN